MTIMIPKKYEKYGHVAVIHATSIDTESARSFADAHRIDVIISSSRSSGELRVPTSSRVLWSRSSDSSPSTETTHKESGVTYIFDPLHIMLSSGNVNERSRFGSTVTAAGETVIDMFAGIGYFSLPLATNRKRKPSQGLKKPDKLIAIEKNEISFSYLQKNFARYSKTACAHELIIGDNREVGNQYLGKCDRVLMGFLPDTAKFIPRALEFASKSRKQCATHRCIIHYHYLFHKSGDEVTQVQRDFGAHVEPSGFRVDDVRVIKSYAHNVYHAVADVCLV